MNKKYLLVIILLVLVSFSVLAFLFLQEKELEDDPSYYVLPYCNHAPAGLHFSLASDYINSNYPDYYVLNDSAALTGPCNHGNTAWTKFDVYESDVLVGNVIVNGDTKEVTFQYEPIQETCDLDCDNYSYSNCPEGCVQRCVSSHCSEGICTDDCDGPGSCSCP